MKKLSLLIGMLIAAATMMFPSTSAYAGQHVWQPSPNGVSPWHYAESWVLYGSWYGEGLHTDQYNDYYALDFGNQCGKPLYPMYNNMTVVYLDSYWGRIDMEVTIDNVRYRTKYLHLNSFSVNVGAVVGTNTVIGYTGNKPSTSCHLHMSVTKLQSDGIWWNIPPTFCGRNYPHDHVTAWKGC